MYELCRFLSRPRAKKARKPAAPAIRVGSKVSLFGETVLVNRKDAKHPGAFFIARNGIEHGLSFQAPMMTLVAAT